MTRRAGVFAARAVVFAAVSSKPQANEDNDKDSIPHQVKRAQSAIEQRNWTESCEPLIVPGQSRSIDFLHEAIEEIPAIAELINLARAGEIDVVVVRDYDRLARTRTLLAQLSSYLSRCKVQIYALDKPVEPVHPSELGRRGRGVQSASVIEAFAGVAAEEEVSRITSRRFFGMNAAMRAGRWIHAKTAYGYTRKAEHSTADNPVYTDVPRIVVEEAAVVNRIEEMYRNEGLGATNIARRLNLENIPSPRGGEWRNTTVLGILKNPFYCGFITWGLTRMTTEFNQGKGEFVSRPAPVQIIQDLRERLGRMPNLFDLLDHVDELAAQDVYVVQGRHEPIRTEETQQAIYDELQLRYTIGSRAASVSGERPPLFSGIIFCGQCNSTAVAVTRSTTTRIYYVCRAHRTGQTCGNGKYTREKFLYEKVLGVLQKIAATPGAIKGYLQEQVDQDAEHLHQERDRLVQALDSIAGRRRRWDDAYEAEVVDLNTYSKRIEGLHQERAGLEHRLGVIEKQLSRARTFDRRRVAILQAVQDPPPPENRAAVKVWLRKIIERVEVTGSEINRIVMRA